MSLFGSIQMASNALKANDIALQVVGQNISNANTPGYIREEVILATAPTQQLGTLQLGLGVKVEAVVQKIDLFLEQRLRGAVSDMSDAETQESYYAQLEGVIGELSDTDLSTYLTDFFSSINEVLNQPESQSVRNLAVLSGQTLTESINHMAEQVINIREDVNDQIIEMADDINNLLLEIRELNLKIAKTEAGDISNSDAVGLRDQRLTALEDLASKLDINVREQSNGMVAVYHDGDYLVFDESVRQIDVILDSEEGLNAASLHISESDKVLDPSAGELAGLLASRDDILGGFLDTLDGFANTLAFEFNKQFSKGQGLSGFQDVTSEFGVTATDQPLNDAGLEFTPVNGSFQIMVTQKTTGQTLTHDIFVDLNGIGEETSMDDLVTMIDDIDGISASVDLSGKLTILSDSSDHEFAFADDTSGVLAALGVNTFFSGSSARDIGVNNVLVKDPALFAASSGGIGHDTDNAVALAALIDTPLESQNGASLAVLYDRMTGEVAQSSAVSQSVAEGARVFEGTLRGQKLSISGVSLDEEAVRMMAYQRAYQAAARFIATLSELMDLTVSL